MTRLGLSECEIEVRENWGIRVVVLHEGKEKVVWGQELKRCAKNYHAGDDPYAARNYHKINRRLLKDIKVGTVVEYPVGQEYFSTKVVRIVRAGSWQRVLYSVPIRKCVHDKSVRVTKRMIERARRINRLWDSGQETGVPNLRERHVISPATFEHLQEWIFSTDLLEPVKASEQSTQRGHCFATKEAVTSTFPRYTNPNPNPNLNPNPIPDSPLHALTHHRYQSHADKQGVDPVSERVYRRVLTQRVFTKYKKDHCMCTTCLRNGWRGTLENGKKAIGELPLSNDSKKQLTIRLKRLWDFIRLQLHLHIEEQSPIAAHCSRLQVGSLADPRFNQHCTHRHARPDTHLASPAAGQDQPHSGRLFKEPTIRATVTTFLDLAGRVSLSTTCRQYRRYWTQEAPESVWQRGKIPPTCDDTTDRCIFGGCDKNTSCHCRHCDKSFCRKHCAEELRCNVVAENLPSFFGSDFVCTTCAPKLDSCLHTTDGCATCSEVQYFKQVNPNPNPYTEHHDISTHAFT